MDAWRSCKNERDIEAILKLLTPHSSLLTSCKKPAPQSFSLRRAENQLAVPLKLRIAAPLMKLVFQASRSHAASRKTISSGDSSAFLIERRLNSPRFHRFGSEGMGAMGRFRRRFSAAPALWMRRVPRRLRHRL